MSIDNGRQRDPAKPSGNAPPPSDDPGAFDTPRKHQPAPAKEPTKNAPSFPPGSPETVPPGPTSA